MSGLVTKRPATTYSPPPPDGYHTHPPIDAHPSAVVNYKVWKEQERSELYEEEEKKPEDDSLTLNAVKLTSSLVQIEGGLHAHLVNQAGGHSPGRGFI